MTYLVITIILYIIALAMWLFVGAVFSLDGGFGEDDWKHWRAFFPVIVFAFWLWPIIIPVFIIWFLIKCSRDAIDLFRKKKF